MFDSEIKRGYLKVAVVLDLAEKVLITLTGNKKFGRYKQITNPITASSGDLYPINN